MSFHLKMTGTSCKADSSVKVPSFQKGHIFFFNIKYTTEALSTCIFVCFEMLLAAVI